MERNALVSIITPCYNGENFLYRYFNSIIAQTYHELELIFVDDGSTDDTGRIAESYREVLEKRGIHFVYYWQEHGGQAKAINAGLQKMRGKYLVWPDSDDLLSPDSIEKRVRYLEQHPDYSFVRSNGDYFDHESGKRLRRISDLENRFNEDIFLDLILEETYCCCGCYMIKSELIREFYPDMKIYESFAGQNWQIMIPIAGKYKCGFIDEDLYHIAIRQDSHSRHKRSFQQAVERYMELKKILEKGVKLSGRTDRDYQEIIDNKYRKTLFRTCLSYRELQKARNIYKELKKTGEAGENERRLYLKEFYPNRYRLYDLFSRVLGKAKRILGKRM